MPRALARLTTAVRDVTYAQQRLFELRTGVSRQRSPARQVALEELEAWWQLSTPDPSSGPGRVSSSSSSSSASRACRSRTGSGS